MVFVAPSLRSHISKFSARGNFCCKCCAHIQQKGIFTILWSILSACSFTLLLPKDRLVRQGELLSCEGCLQLMRVTLSRGSPINCEPPDTSLTSRHKRGRGSFLKAHSPNILNCYKHSK